jgi:hypothetical protein
LEVPLGAIIIYLLYIFSLICVDLFIVSPQNESLAVQKKFQTEIARVEDALMQVRRDYELLRMKYEHYLKTNEQTGW